MPKELEGVSSPFIQSAIDIWDQAIESEGQKEDLQEILAKIHLKKRWDKESFSALHKGHSRSAGEMGKMELSLDLVGIISQAIFHKKRDNLALILSPHKSFQVEGRKEQ